VMAAPRPERPSGAGAPETGGRGRSPPTGEGAGRSLGSSGRRDKTARCVASEPAGDRGRRGSGGSAPPGPPSSGRSGPDPRSPRPDLPAVPLVPREALQVVLVDVLRDPEEPGFLGTRLGELVDPPPSLHQAF